MALVRLSVRSKIYEVVNKWKTDCLQQDYSLFETGASVWNLENLGVVYNQFSLAQDSSSDSFLTKLERQIGAAPPLVIQLMAEILYIYFLPAVPEAVRGEKKREIISKILAWMPSKINVPPELDNILDSGIWHPGVGFNTLRPNHLRFVVNFALAWKHSAPSKRSEFLNDPWRFKEFLLDLPIDKAFAQRDTFLHLFFPESFEDIVAREAKKRITKELAGLISDPTDDVDRALLQIRRTLSVEHGNEFTFYDPPIIKLWQPDASPWGRFIAWAERFYNWGKYSSEEREYKIEIGNRLAAVADCIGSESEDWKKLLKQAFAPSKNNLVYYMTVQRFMEWVEQDPEARSSLSDLWKGPEPIEHRIQTFLKRLPQKQYMHGPGQRVSILSVLLMG